MTPDHPRWGLFTWYEQGVIALALEQFVPYPESDRDFLAALAQLRDELMPPSTEEMQRRLLAEEQADQERRKED